VPSPQANDGGLEAFSLQALQPIAASSMSSTLPAGHTLSFVLRDQGESIAHIMHPSIREIPGATVCLREYVRYDAASKMPGPFTAFGQPILASDGSFLRTCDNPSGCDQQQKLMTLSGEFPTEANSFLTAQISIGQDGHIHSRFDGNMFLPPQDFQELGTIPANCVGNFCRLEICLDYSTLGEGRLRLRRTNVAPGSGQTTVNKPVGTRCRRADGVQQPGAACSTTSAPDLSGTNSVTAGGLAMFAQYFNPTRYNSHFIMTRVRPEDRNFWPGAACEVEGGCTGTPPTFFPLTITAAGTGSGTFTGNGSFASGSIVGIGAIANPGSTFNGWGGDPDCSDASVTMNGPKTCVANFSGGGATIPNAPARLRLVP
jgi:hypothetical protein